MSDDDARPDANVGDQSRAGLRPAPRPRRFYKTTGLRPEGALFIVTLDGRPAKTPGGAVLAAAEQQLAEAIAAEWAGQGAEIDATTMPLTRLANVAIDAIPGNAEAVRADIVKYAGSDLVCYRADDPIALVNRQKAHWDPVLFFFAERHQAHFIVQSGIVFKEQPAAALAAIASVVSAYDGLYLAALHSLTTLCGSALMALCVAEGAMSGEAAVAAAHVDEDWNRELWGADEEALAARAGRARDILAAASIFASGSGHAKSSR